MVARSSAAAMLGVIVLCLIWSSNQAEGATTKRLQFFMHDNFSLEPKTVIAVAAGPGKGNTSFGAISVIDDALTEGPLPASKLIGRAQGTYMVSAMDDSSLLLTFTAVFSSGDETGSTLSFHGADRFLLPQREISVIGGSGKFRGARGYAVLNTTSNTNKATIVGFDVTILV